jgi:hypothetical protein
MARCIEKAGQVFSLDPTQIVEINMKFKGMDIKPGMRICITALDEYGLKFTVEGPVYTANWWEDPHIATTGVEGYVGKAQGGWYIELKGESGSVRHSRQGMPGYIIPDDYTYCKACQDRVINLEILDG